MSDYLCTLCKLAEEIQPVANAKVAACIVYKGRIISFGINKMKSDPLQKRFASNEFKIYLHAEVSAIKGALKHLTLDQLKKSNLYVARVKRPFSGSKDWVAGLAKPCAGCAMCIDTFGIEKVVYTQ